MRKLLILTAVAALCASCLEPFDDTSFTPEKAVMSFSEPTKTVSKDACTFEVALKSNLPWRIKKSATMTWASVTPERGMGDTVLTVKVQKNRTVEERKDFFDAVVTDDQFCTFTLTQEPSQGGAANTYYVKENGSAQASGLSWTNATTLAAAIEQAAAGDSILVAAGTYSPSAFLTSSSESEGGNKTFEVHSNFALIGGYPVDAGDAGFNPSKDYDPSKNVTTLSGDIDASTKAYHVVTVTALPATGQKVVIKGFTITGGEASDVDESYSVSGITYNKSYGGGLVVGPAVCECSDLIVRANASKNHAAGVYLKGEGVITIRDSRIVNNESDKNAGGVWNCGATLYMYNSTIGDNIASQQAAGFYSINSEGVPSVSRFYNCTISGNDNSATSGRSGGGAYIREWSDCVFIQCTFSGNKSGNGGGIQGYGGNGKNSKLTLISCTFTGNSATIMGGGVSLWNNYNTTNIYNCIISGNNAPAGADIGYGASIATTPNLFYYTTIVGNTLYESTGSAKGGWSFDVATNLKALGMWGGRTETCPVIESATNPAWSQGMSKEALTNIGSGFSPAVESTAYDSDQRGVARKGNTIGSCTQD